MTDRPNQCKGCWLKHHHPLKGTVPRKAAAGRRLRCTRMEESACSSVSTLSTSVSGALWHHGMQFLTCKGWGAPPNEAGAAFFLFSPRTLSPSFSTRPITHVIMEYTLSPVHKQTVQSTDSGITCMLECSRTWRQNT